MVQNLVMKVDKPCNSGHTNFGPYRLNLEAVKAVQCLRIRHYIQVCDLVKIGAHVLSRDFSDDFPC